MRYDAEHKKTTRQRILRSASRALRAFGPSELRVAGVMRDAGLTHGGFYAHFASKDAMIEASIALMFEDSQYLWVKATGKRSAGDGLDAYIDLYLSPTHMHATDRGCPVAALAADAARMSPSILKAFSKGLEAQICQICSSLEQQGFANPKPLATSIFAELVGSLTFARIQPSRIGSIEMLEASRLSIRHRLANRSVAFSAPQILF